MGVGSLPPESQVGTRRGSTRRTPFTPDVDYLENAGCTLVGGGGINERLRHTAGVGVVYDLMVSETQDMIKTGYQRCTPGRGEGRYH